VTRLRVGVNLLWLLPDAAGGAEEYAIRVLRALGDEAADRVEVTLFCNRRFPEAHPDLAVRFETAVAPIDGGSRPTRVAAESTWLARETGRRPLDLVHHLNDVIPWVRRRPSVLTIHDLRALERPETLGRVQGAYLRARLGPSVRRSAVITTPSGFVRERVIDRLGVDPGRVVVVSAPVLLPARAGSSTEPPAEHSFFVYPAITSPHKNHLVLLEAFARVAAERGDVDLVLTGAPGRAEAAVRDAIGRLRLDGRVRRVGRIPGPKLVRLLQGASALVYPSRYEGFGLPLAEAMAVDCPVIASNVTALPEVVGRAGVLLDPDDVGGWAEAMRRLLEDASARMAMIEAGRERVGALTPAETARRLVGAYRMAADGR
jgi:glycosyltransferase involved in cell wall biosynthesis